MSASQFADRLAARAVAAGVALEPHSVEQLARYFELLRRWNNTINLTALPLDPATDEAIDRLFVEPLAAARALARTAEILPAGDARWIDVGSGGGSPAIPMKVVLPAYPLTMIESKSRKAAFLREVVRTLRLADVSVENVRVEELRGVAAAALVTVRAVRFELDLARAATLLLCDRGRLALFRRTKEVRQLPGFASIAVEPVVPALQSWLHIYLRMFHVEH